MIISKERMAHMHGVAEYMYNHAEKYGLDPEEMYVLGLLHDIGYMNGKESHEENGSALLHRLGLTNHWDILWHGTSPQNYMLYTAKDELPPSLILLLAADMMVDLSGEEVGFEKRLESIANTYGLASEEYSMCEETVDWLLEKEFLKESDKMESEEGMEDESTQD